MIAEAKSQPTDEQFATRANRLSPVATATTAASASQATTAPITAAVGKRFASKAIIRPDKKPVRASSSGPEILVPPDSGNSLPGPLCPGSIQAASTSHRPPLLLTEVATDQTVPLQVPLIQIAELDVKPLADSERENDQKYDQEV